MTRSHFIKFRMFKNSGTYQHNGFFKIAQKLETSCPREFSAEKTELALPLKCFRNESNGDYSARMTKIIEDCYARMQV